MKSALCPCSVALGGLLLLAPHVSAGWPNADLIPAYQFDYVPQTVTCWRPETFYRDVDTLVEEPTYKTVTKQFSVTVLEEQFRDVEHEGTFWKWVPRTVEVDVVRCRPTAPPELGVTAAPPETYTERVQQVVLDRIAEKRKYTERVTFYRPVERRYEQDFVVREVTTKTVKVREPFTRLVPYQATVLVPAFVPSAQPRGCP